jgi:hypothetical protein
MKLGDIRSAWVRTPATLIALQERIKKTRNA